MRAKIKKIKSVFPVSVASAVYQEGTNKSLKDMIDNGEFGAKLNNRDMYAGEIFELEDTSKIDIPVKKGLVSFLDGRFIGSDNKSWIDEVTKNSVVFPYGYLDANHIQFKEGGMFINIRSDLRPYIINPIKDATEYTIEIIFKYSGGEYWSGILGLANVIADYPDDKGFNISLGTINNYSFYPNDSFMGTAKPIGADSTKKLMTTIVFKPDEGYCYTNGDKKHTFIGTHVLHSNHFILGGRKNDTGDDAGPGCADGRVGLYIYQVKFYNRALTDEEIAQNWAHEQTIER